MAPTSSFLRGDGIHRHRSATEAGGVIVVVKKNGFGSRSDSDDAAWHRSGLCGRCVSNDRTHQDLDELFLTFPLDPVPMRREERRAGKTDKEPD